MSFLKELLQLTEDSDYDEIPPRVMRVLRDCDIKYPGVKTLSDLKTAHAKQIIARGYKPDSDEKALSYALGMASLSHEEIDDIANPPKSKTDSAGQSGPSPEEIE